MKGGIMLSPKSLRFQVASSLLAADGTDNPDAIAELNAMASILGRWAPKAGTKRIVKSGRPIELQPNPNDRPEQVKPGQSDRDVQQNETSTPIEPGQRTTPGRRPLFRNRDAQPTKPEVRVSGLRRDLC
jgi:hypothetical protein